MELQNQNIVPFTGQPTEANLAEAEASTTIPSMYTDRSGKRRLFTGLHRTICRMYVQGFSQTEIARYTGCNICTVGNVLKSELGQRHIENLSKTLDLKVKDVSSMLQETSIASQRFLTAIAAGELEVNLALRAKVAMDQLDRAGYGKINKNVNLDVQGSLSASELDEIKRRAFSRPNIVADSVEPSAYDSALTRAFEVSDMDEDGDEDTGVDPFLSDEQADSLEFDGESFEFDGEEPDEDGLLSELPDISTNSEENFDGKS